MKAWILYMFVFRLFQIGLTDLLAKNPNNYGPYIVEWEYFDPCRGPKMANLTSFSTKLIKLDNHMYRGTLNITFLEQTRVEEIKMSVYSLKENNTKSILWNYVINKPCQHYVLATLLEVQLGVKNCVVKKSSFYSDFNLSEIMNNYIGKSFFYGDYLFKVVATSKKGNIACFIFDPKFKKKKN